MPYTIESFAAKCHDIIAEDQGPCGLERVRQELQKALMDDDFVAAYLGPDNHEPRTILYEDPEFGFCIVAHVHEGAKVSQPHDHGPTWAFYGQAAGETEMSEWKLLEAPKGDVPGKVALDRRYTMKRGDAYLYDKGDLHSPRREHATRLIRIEGKNLDTVKRSPFAAIEQAAE